MTLSRQSIYGAGIAAALLTAIALAAANFITDDSSGSGGGPEYLITLGASLVIAVALFGWTIPRTTRPARVGLVVGVIALLSLGAFWTGLPYVLGPAAIVLGWIGRARSETRTQAAIAIVLGALATLAGIAAIVLDQMS